MNRLSLIAASGLIALSAAGCAVEVPMSAFRMAPPDAGQKAGAKQLPPEGARPLSIR